MKTPFKIVVNAKSAEEAFDKVKVEYGKSAFREIAEEPSFVRAAVETKAKRVLENPVLYADKAKEYWQMFQAFDTAAEKEEAVIDLLIAHGDSRLDNPRFCGVRRSTKPGKWVVFGFKF
jgi:hypothetical protein